MDLSGLYPVTPSILSLDVCYLTTANTPFYYLSEIENSFWKAILQRLHFVAQNCA